jgi:hypothetical protein
MLDSTFLHCVAGIVARFRAGLQGAVRETFFAGSPHCQEFLSNWLQHILLRAMRECGAGNLKQPRFDVACGRRWNRAPPETRQALPQANANPARLTRFC